MTRTGKIARLPSEIREKLNARLRDGQSGRTLLRWLNDLPEVRSILRRDFSGAAINDQNLSAWKLGGYREWLARQELLATVRGLAETAAGLVAAARGSLSDHLAAVVAGRYAAALALLDTGASAEALHALQSLRHVCRDIVELRRGDHSAAWLAIEQERLEREREKTNEDIVAIFQRWAANPNVREWFLSEPADPAERWRQMREIFGLPPEPPEPPEPLEKDEAKPAKPAGFMENALRDTEIQTN